LACLEAIQKDATALHTRMDAYEEAGKSAKLPKDGAEAAMDKKKDGEREVEEEGDPRPLRADKKADAFADSDARRNALGEIHHDAQTASNAWGENARTPWTNERPEEYLRRAAQPHKQHSVDLHELSGQSLKNATQQIFKDSLAASCNNETYVGDTLREFRRHCPDTGHIIKEFYGDPMSWMSQFTGGRRLAKFNLDPATRIKR
jgi:hypothetical protein